MFERAWFKETQNEMVVVLPLNRVLQVATCGHLDAKVFLLEVKAGGTRPATFSREGSSRGKGNETT